MSLHYMKVYRTAYNGAHQQQGSLLAAESVLGLRVTETTLSRIDGPKTQQIETFIYGLRTETEESGSENQLEHL